MTPLTSDHCASHERLQRCPAYAQPLVELVRGRCPLCDHQIEDEPVTAGDTTPYAQGRQPGWRDWWTMTGWMWGAGAGRLSHLSLMQASPAARQYSRRTLLPVMLTVALCWLALTGWHAVKPLPVEAGGQAPQPVGRGWCALATVPTRAVDAAGDPSRIIAWWWNPPLAMLGAAAALVWAFVLWMALMAILRAGLERALSRRYRGQQRLSAALHYGTAWVVPLVPAGLILSLLPLCRLAEVGDWPIKPPDAFVYVPAAVLAGLAVCMGWFGLIRLASTVPIRTRTRVVLFSGLWMPLIAAALIAGSIWGLSRLHQAAAPALQLQW